MMSKCRKCHLSETKFVQFPGGTYMYPQTPLFSFKISGMNNMCPVCFPYPRPKHSCTVRWEPTILPASRQMTQMNSCCLCWTQGPQSDPALKQVMHVIITSLWPPRILHECWVHMSTSEVGGKLYCPFRKVNFPVKCSCELKQFFACMFKHQGPVVQSPIKLILD